MLCLWSRLVSSYPASWLDVFPVTITCCLSVSPSTPWLCANWDKPPHRVTLRGSSMHQLLSVTSCKEHTHEVKVLAFIISTFGVSCPHTQRLMIWLLVLISILVWSRLTLGLETKGYVTQMKLPYCSLSVWVGDEEFPLFLKHSSKNLFFFFYMCIWAHVCVGNIIY